MDLRSVSVITRNIVASRTEADLLRVVCSLLVQSCRAEAAAVWLTHRNKGMTARPDHWFSNSIPVQQQSLLIDPNHVVGGLRGTGPYLKKVQALPPIDQTLDYIAAPLVFDGGIRGLLAVWAQPDQAGALPDLIDLASQLTAVRLRGLTDASRLTEQQLSIQAAHQELLVARQQYLTEEQSATAAYLAALISLQWQAPVTHARAALPPTSPPDLARAGGDLDTVLAEMNRLAGILRVDSRLTAITAAGATVDLADLAAQLCLRAGFKLAWEGTRPGPAASRYGAPAIFRALALEVFSRMKSNQSLHVTHGGIAEWAVFGLYADALTPALNQWAAGEAATPPAPATESAPLQLARLLAARLKGHVRCTPREFDGVGAVLMLPRAALE